VPKPPALSCAHMDEYGTAHRTAQRLHGLSPLHAAAHLHAHDVPLAGTRMDRVIGNASAVSAFCSHPPITFCPNSSLTCVACPPVLTLRSLAFCGLSRPCRGLVWRAASYAYALLSVFLSRCWTSHAHTRTLRAQGRLSEDYRANRKYCIHTSRLSAW